VPTVSVWGPTHPARDGAYGSGHQAVYHEPTCSFCWKRKCPVGTHECMDRVTGEDVYRAIKKIVSENIKVTITS
jgi:ADP-heptose:LPS heptosyltransferase